MFLIKLKNYNSISQMEHAQEPSTNAWLDLYYAKSAAWECNATARATLIKYMVSKQRQ